MPSYSVATSKDKLSSLIDKALAGEEVVITRRGKPAARLVPVAENAPPRKDVRAAMEELREWQKTQRPLDIDIPYHRFSEWLNEDPED